MESKTLEGYYAYLDGLDKMDNPYSLWTEEAEYWSYGWDLAYSTRLV